MARVRESVFEKLEKVTTLVQEAIPAIDKKQLCVILGRLATFHYQKRKGFLLGDERSLYNLLIENSYNPSTVYKWLLLERVPDEIKFQLRNHYLSQKKASRLWTERRHETDLGLQQDIRQLGLQLIREM